MSELNPNLAPSATWRDKIVPLSIGIGILCLIFRPLFINDIKELLNPTPPMPGPWGPEPIDTVGIWLEFGSDLLCFAILTASVFFITVGRVGSIVYNTFREAVRNRILYFILIFALIMIGASLVFRELAVAAQDRMVTDLGLSSISFFGLLLAVMVGISLVYNELERKTIYTIVSKPIHRHQFLLGKFFGLLMTIYVIVAIMALFFFIILQYHSLANETVFEPKFGDALRQMRDAGTEITGAIYNTTRMKMLAVCMVKAFGFGCTNLLGFATGAVSQTLLAVVGMICLQLMIVTAIAILFSSFTTPTLSALFTVMIYMAGSLNEDIVLLYQNIISAAIKTQGVMTAGDLEGMVVFKAGLVKFAALIVPNLDSLNASDMLYKEGVVMWRYPMLYAICYTGSILMIAILIFRKRNFK